MAATTSSSVTSGWGGSVGRWGEGGGVAGSASQEQWVKQL